MVSIRILGKLQILKNLSDLFLRLLNLCPRSYGQMLVFRRMHCGIEIEFLATLKTELLEEGFLPQPHLVKLEHLLQKYLKRLTPVLV